MKRKIVPLIFILISPFSSATDWIIPEPVTYEWTVEKTRRVIPKVDMEDATIRQVIFFLGNSMDSPIRLKHDLPPDILDKKLEWHLKDVVWIDLVAKIADIAKADIVIGKQMVTLRCQEQIENEQKPDMATPSQPPE